MRTAVSGCSDISQPQLSHDVHHNANFGNLLNESTCSTVLRCDLGRISCSRMPNCLFFCASKQSRPSGTDKLHTEAADTRRRSRSRTLRFLRLSGSFPRKCINGSQKGHSHGNVSAGSQHQANYAPRSTRTRKALHCTFTVLAEIIWALDHLSD